MLLGRTKEQKVVIGPWERSQYAASDEFWSEHGELVIRSGDYSLYQLSDIPQGLARWCAGHQKGPRPPKAGSESVAPSPYGSESLDMDGFAGLPFRQRNSRQASACTG